MTTVEEQVRLYAEAITADKPLVPEHRPEASKPSGWSRGVFLAAAAVLVVLLGVGAVIALQSRSTDPVPTSATATAGDLTTTLEVSTTTPDADTVVTATATVTNHGVADVQIPAACRFTIAVVTDPPDQLTFPSGSTWLTWSAGAQYGHGLFRPADRQTFPALSIDDLAAIAAGDTGPATQKATTCTDEITTTLAPGESTSVTKALTVGELGMSAGPAQVTTQMVGQPESANPKVAITLPEPSTDPINRRDAIDLALAQPEVQPIIAAIPDQPAPDATDSIVVWPVGDSWQVGYANSGTRSAFLVTVSNRGEVTSIETFPS